MTDEPDNKGFDALIDALVDDERLLRAIVDRLSRRKAFRDAVDNARDRTIKTSPPPQEILDRSVLSTALREFLDRPDRPPDQSFAVIIELNLSHGGSVTDTNQELAALIAQHLPEVVLNAAKARRLPQYVFARLTAAELSELVQLGLHPDGRQPTAQVEVTTTRRLIHRIWPDFPIQARLHRTGATVKAEAARVAFAAGGQDIVWAVMDSGIDGSHPHFARHGNLDVAPLQHVSLLEDGDDPLTDEFGHGTHVAGIIAGEWRPETPVPADAQAYQQPFTARVAYRDERDVEYRTLAVDHISGIAPRCKLVSYKVLDEDGVGEVSNLMAALADVQEKNGYGKLLRIHGVNISVGYAFDPEWFACGQSPVCVEVNRLVRSGVVVVVAAGNTGYGTIASNALGPVSTGLAMTINDPGNAELAITVGAAHRDSPHTYGVSFFSSKGPTGDGRLKPDLVAPGERILSCAAGKKRQLMRQKGGDADYAEESGTSMATPHVAGAVAAFLSVQQEYIGRPEEVKRIMMAAATDLGRHRDFQGAGMVDVMRAIQSV